MPITADEAVKEALEYFRVQDPKDYKELTNPKNSGEFEKIIAAAKKSAEESLSSTLTVPEELAKHLPQERVKMIQDGLSIPTYTLTIKKKGDVPIVEITRDGKQLMEPIPLRNDENVANANELQYASIVIEAIILLAQAIGIRADVSAGTLQTLVAEIRQIVANTTALVGAINALRGAMNGGTRMQQARGVYNVITAAHQAGILWIVMRGAFANMTYWDWIRSALQMIAVITASVSTEGLALIAKIALALASAAIFLRKFTNLDELEEFLRRLRARQR